MKKDLELQEELQEELPEWYTVSEFKKECKETRLKLQQYIEKNVRETDFAEVHPTGNVTDMEWSFVELIKEAKKCNMDMIDLLHGKISITEVEV